MLNFFFFSKVQFYKIIIKWSNGPSNENLEKFKNQRKINKIRKRVIETHQIHQNNPKSYKIFFEKLR